MVAVPDPELLTFLWSLHQEWPHALVPATLRLAACRARRLLAEEEANPDHNARRAATNSKD